MKKKQTNEEVHVILQSTDQKLALAALARGFVITHQVAAVFFCMK